MDDLNEKIETEKKAEKNLIKLKNEVSNLNLKGGGLDVFRGVINKKINRLLKEKLEIILEETILIEKEIKDLKIFSKEKFISLEKNDLDWLKPKLKIKTEEGPKTIKLYKNILYHSTCNELEQKILYAKENKELDMGHK